MFLQKPQFINLEFALNDRFVLRNVVGICVQLAFRKDRWVRGVQSGKQVHYRSQQSKHVL